MARVESHLEEAVREAFQPEPTSRWYRAMRQYWHPVAYARDVGEKPVGVTLLERPLVLVRLGGELVCLSGICRHKGAALSLGWVEEGCRLVCAYHGWQYDASGQVVKVPSNPELSGRLRARVERFCVAESAGMVWVCLDDEPRFGVPEVPEWDDPSIRWLVPDSYEWRTSAPRRLENFVDFAHFPWVHEGILGSRDHPEVHEHDVTRDGGTLVFGKEGWEPNDPRKRELLGLADRDLIYGVNRYRLFMPCSIYLHRTFRDNGRRYLLFMAASPVGPRLTRSFWLQGRDFGVEPEHDAFMLEFEDTVLEQDKPIVESQRPEHLPDQLSTELYVKVADRVTLEYRLFLHELAREHEEAQGA